MAYDAWAALPKGDRVKACFEYTYDLRVQLYWKGIGALEVLEAGLKEGTVWTEAKRHDKHLHIVREQGHAQTRLPALRCCDRDVPDGLHLDINAATFFLKAVWAEVLSQATSRVGVDNDHVVREFFDCLDSCQVLGGKELFQEQWDELKEQRKKTRSGKDKSSGKKASKNKDRIRLNGAAASHVFQAFSRIARCGLPGDTATPLERVRWCELHYFGYLLQQCSSLYSRSAVRSVELEELAARGRELATLLSKFRASSITPTLVNICFGTWWRCKKVFQEFGLTPAMFSTQSNERRNKEIKEALKHNSNRSKKGKQNKWFQVLKRARIVDVYLAFHDPRAPCKRPANTLSRILHDVIEVCTRPVHTLCNTINTGDEHTLCNIVDNVDIAGCVYMEVFVKHYCSFCRFAELTARSTSTCTHCVLASHLLGDTLITGRLSIHILSSIPKCLREAHEHHTHATVPLLLSPTSISLMTVAVLQNTCASLSLDTRGLKSALIERLIGALQ